MRTAGPTVGGMALMIGGFYIQRKGLPILGNPAMTSLAAVQIAKASYDAVCDTNFYADTSTQIRADATVGEFVRAQIEVEDEIIKGTLVPQMRPRRVFIASVLACEVLAVDALPHFIH